MSFKISKREEVIGMNSEPITSVKVNLVGQDGNAFSIIGAVTRAMREAQIDEEIIKKYMAEATSGDYDNLLQTTMKYVEIT